MTKKFSNTLILFLLFFVFVSSQRSFSQCFQIESILVAACSTPPPAPTTEGYNEMVRFKVGSVALNTSTLNVNWPSNAWQGLIKNAITAAKVATLNADIDAVGGCGNLLEPTGGVLPANASVILVTSYMMDTNSNSFGALAEDTYIIFQNNTATVGGHFANYNPAPGLRTLSMSFGGGCSDSVTYDRTLLANATGATVLFTPAGVASYVNYGCVAPVPPFTVDAGTAPLNPCAGSTIALSGTAVGQQSVAWTAPSGTFSASTNLTTNYTIPANAAGQTITITLTATNSCSTSITDTVTLTVGNATTPTFNLPTTLCNGAPAPALPTTSSNGITGTWLPTSISNTTNGSYVFTPNAGQCSIPFTLNVTVQNAITPVTDFSYATPVCVNSTSMMPIPGPGFTSGGTYGSDTGLTINPATGEINPSTSTPGSHSIIYTVAANPSACLLADTGNFTIQIVNLITPITDFTYPTPICVNSAPISPIPATGFTTGGTYASDAGLSINLTTGVINVAASTVGPHVVTYTIAADLPNCKQGGSSPFTVTINTSITPITSFSYATPVCGNSPIINPIPAAGFVTGGAYTSDAGLSININTGAINVAASTTGSHTITYTINPDPANCNTGGSDIFTVLINPVFTPVTDFSYATPVCSNSAPINPIPAAGFTPGGTYTSDAGLSINATTGEITIATSTVGPHTVTYTINADPTTCNIGGSDIFTVTINAVFTPLAAFSYTTPICPDSAPVNPTLGAGSFGGGVFSSDPGLIINPNTGQINVVASTPGPHTITYTILPNAATCNLGNSDNFIITIDVTSAVAPITGSTFVCVGETIQLSNATPGGTWSSSDVTVATVDNNGLVTGVTSNYVDIIYTLNNGCSTKAISNITVYANPNPLLENKYLCVSNTSGVPYNTVLLECGIPNVNFSFVWTFNGAPLPTTTNAHLATALGTYEVTVTNTISGCSNTASCTVSASSTAVATATVGEDFNQNQVITVNVTGGSGDYMFQLDHGIPQQSNVFPFVHQGEYTITVIDKNGCQDLELIVFALNYPRFFTPNGDGYNDTWGIKGLTDLKAKTFIYDRFGKLVKYLNAFGEEWDGTLNGHELPSTDYWFVLEYKNREGLDKEFKAHFSLKR